jgi:hypothetical protein
LLSFTRLRNSRKSSKCRRRSKPRLSERRNSKWFHRTVSTPTPFSPWCAIAAAAVVAAADFAEAVSVVAVSVAADFVAAVFAMADFIAEGFTVLVFGVAAFTITTFTIAGFDAGRAGDARTVPGAP